jgi:predicted DNA-binding transcriptional regulator YafY
MSGNVMPVSKQEESIETPLLFAVPFSGDEEFIDYTNYRGERSIRRVVPLGVVFKATEFHPEAQWILSAWCLEREAMREFAVKDIHNWKAK